MITNWEGKSKKRELRTGKEQKGNNEYGSRGK